MPANSKQPQQPPARKALVTTEKDAQNLSGVTFTQLPVYIAVIDLEISKEACFSRLIHEKIQARQSGRMKILIRATNWVGDAILALPALRAVRTKFPDAHIAIVARPYVADIYRDQSICDELIPYDPKGEHRGWKGREQLSQNLRAKSSTSRFSCKTPSTPPGWPGAPRYPNASATRATAAAFSSPKPSPVPKPGEIPAHEKFYYLELLRRAGWLDTLQDEPHITLASLRPAARQRAAAISSRSRRDAPTLCASP